MLGIVSKLYDELNGAKRCFLAKDWSDLCGLKRVERYGGQFNCSQCKQLLNSLDKLESISYTESD